MRRLVFALSIAIVLVSLMGCAEKVVDNDIEIVNQKLETGEKSGEKEALSILGNYEKALQILDCGLNSGLDERINIQEEIGVVELQKVDSRHYLVAYYNYPRYPMTNLFYSMVDLENETINPIYVLSPEDYIEDVYIDVDNMKLKFVYGGRNINNGFKEYPFDVIYSITQKTYLVENEYTKINRYSKITVGNGINIAGIKSIEGYGEEIIFRFTKVEGTILAGGNISPNITIGRVEDEEVARLYIDFENTVLTKGAKDQILALENLDYINKVAVREYLDANEGNHVVIYLTVEDVEEYKGQFTIVEDNDILGFRLEFNKR